MRAGWVAPLMALGFATLSCSSAGGKKALAQAPGDDGGVSASGEDGGAASVVAGSTNLDGFSYPPPPYGRTPRSGSTRGRIIDPFNFLGYPKAVITPDLQHVSLADYYDPCERRHKLIHLTVAAVWCVPCNQETDAFVAAAAQLAAQGVVVVQALDDGPVLGTGATVNDLQKWITRHTTTFTEVLDPDPNPVLGGFFDAAAVPWNADIDPRTMEILSSGTGWAGDVATELAPALSAVAAAPRYAALVSCN